MAAIAARHGPADVLIVRHILEHAEDVQTFVQGIAALLKPAGLLMVEVPDCTISLKHADYCMVWDKHSLYLTPATFEQLLSIGGFETVSSRVYPLPFENSLVILARKTGASATMRINPAARTEAGLLARYAAAYEPARRELRRTHCSSFGQKRA